MRSTQMTISSTSILGFNNDDVIKNGKRYLFFSRECTLLPFPRCRNASSLRHAICAQTRSKETRKPRLLETIIMKVHVFHYFVVLCFHNVVQALLCTDAKPPPYRLNGQPSHHPSTLCQRLHRRQFSPRIGGGGGTSGTTQRKLSPEDEEIFFRYDPHRRISHDGAKHNNSNKNTNTTLSSSSSFLDDLTPPPFNFARDSILFSENPATRRNNAMTQLWGVCQRYLPPVMTGSWPWRDPSVMEHNPFGALYNMVLVRIPTICIALVYLHNLWEGHGWIVDFGLGAFEMSPIVVLSVLALILA